MAGTITGCGNAAVHVVYPNASSPTKQFIQIGRTNSGHVSTADGTGISKLFLSSQAVIKADDLSIVGSAIPPIGYPTTWPTWNGYKAEVGTKVQQYLSQAQSPVASTNDNRRWGLDANAINPGSGSGGNIITNGICHDVDCGTSGTRIIENVSGNVWKISILNTLNYYKQPMLGWVGPKALKDISGPGSNILAAADWTMCKPLVDGECVAGSVAADNIGYVKAPKIWTSSNAVYAGYCQTGMEILNTACLMAGQPGAGMSRQFLTDRPHVTGADNRMLTASMRPYGTIYPYWGVRAHPAGYLAMASPGGKTQGIRNLWWLIRLPGDFPDTSAKSVAPDFKLKVGPVSGKTHVQVSWGYNSSLQCTERNERCISGAGGTNGFRFATIEAASLSATALSTGVDISIPATPGRVLFYRVEYCTSTTACDTTGEIERVVP